MSRQNVLAAKSAHISLGGRTILDGIDLELFPGELVALVGPNGAGKSTLLGALCGDVSLDSGSIELHSRVLGSWNVKELAKVRAVQMQETKVSFAFSAADVVRMGRAPWTGSEEAHRDDQVVLDALTITDTTALAPRTFQTLSGGEKARVSFARAMAQETQIIMLDEPTAAMDIRYQEQLLTLTQQRAAAGATAVVVLHDLSLAAAYADRIVLMQDGRIRSVGTPREVLQPEILEDVYRHPVAVIEHPGSGGLIIAPLRPHLNAQTFRVEELV
ncbi:MAG: heme ABC transporter ATP-binding protein [Micrococcaceae bacterium]|nr:heme ABC transporter ATP-binding protein [Micrococcaceae bacterium]